MHTPNKSKECEKNELERTERILTHEKIEKKNHWCACVCARVVWCITEIPSHAAIFTGFGLRCAAPNRRNGERPEQKVHTHKIGKVSKTPGTIHSFAHPEIRCQRWSTLAMSIVLWPIVRLGPSFLADIKFTTNIIEFIFHPICDARTEHRFSPYLRWTYARARPNYIHERQKVNAKYKFQFITYLIGEHRVAQSRWKLTSNGMQLTKKHLVDHQSPMQ